MITDFLNTRKQPSYREEQFNTAYYQQLIDSFDELTTWSKPLREELKTEIPFTTLKEVRRVKSQDGGTEKIVFSRDKDGSLFEAVLMRFQDGRNSLCVSCMIGCSVGCTFCATGKMGFKDILSYREIVDQLMHVLRFLKAEGETVSNIVFMGMGEPLLNFFEVSKAIAVITDPEKIGMSPRRITISTSGYADRIKELADKDFKGGLAISLHGPNQALREELMPAAAKAYSLMQLMAALDYYVLKTNNRVTYEYILIEEVNDTPEQAHELVDLLKDRLAHVNLIPYNPVAGANYKRPDIERIRQFSHILSGHHISNTVRVTMGDDIKAACGQLATE